MKRASHASGQSGRDLCFVFLASALGVALCVGCSRRTEPNLDHSLPPDLAAPSATPSSTRPAVSVASTGPAEPSPLTPISDAEFNRLIEQLSEPDSGFISDNYLSNETSYLQVAPQLERVCSRGGAYLGVGPEQNFSYIALTRPSLAVIVDIRRANLLLQLLYKAAFELATSRAHFLALMLSRPWPASGRAVVAGADGDIGVEQVIAEVSSLESSPKTFEATHGRLIEHLRQARRIRLSEADLSELRRAHRAFFEQQLQLAFELKQHSTRRYPTLDELLLARDPSGRASGFLGSDAAFERVQRLQRQNRVVPVVGDFSGKHALAAVAEQLRVRQLTLSAFYVSNVEQYLLAEPKVWSRWRDNLLRMPADEHTLLIRAYLDQGAPHAAQLPGHRTTTVLQRLDAAQRQWMVSPPTSPLELTSRGLASGSR